MLQLRCAAQNYDWGRKSEDSEVAKLARANGNTVDDSKPFAELWMGAHPNCPSTLKATGESLQACLERFPQLLGAKVQQHFGTQLPFLFKVLSVAKALSIQSHPDKQLAQRLHRDHPKLYADPNHKPEMALALSGFEALCGFAGTEELQARLRRLPELTAAIGPHNLEALLALPPTPREGQQDAPSRPVGQGTSPNGLLGAVEGVGASAVAVEGEDAAATKRVLRGAFTALMTAAPEVVTGAVRALVARLEAVDAAALTAHEALALRLQRQFPDDVGLLSSFFLNLIQLPPGSAIYLPANEPHAYLAGELVECMAASDNVIRAGLTPKFKHAEVLCESLTYRQGPPDVLAGTPAGPGITVYRPPFEEFEIHRITTAPTPNCSNCPNDPTTPSQPPPPASNETANDAATTTTTTTPAPPAGGAVLLPASQGPRILLVQSGTAEAVVVHGAAASGEKAEAEERTSLPAELQPLVAEGVLETRTVLQRGNVVLLAPGVGLELRSTRGPGEEGLLVWAAAVNASFFALQEARQGAGKGEGEVAHEGLERQAVMSAA